MKPESSSAISSQYVRLPQMTVKSDFVGFSSAYDPAATGIACQEKANHFGRMIRQLRARFEETRVFI